MKISTLSISFHLPLHPNKVGAFRKYLLSLSDLSEPLMHNHDPETGNSISRYPLVQYRSVNGKAVFYAINEGIPALRRFLDQSVAYMDAGEPSLWSQVEKLEEKVHYVSMSDKMHLYRLTEYIPFDRVKKDNRNAYVEWKQCVDMKERCDLIERILKNNIVTFCKYMGYVPEGQIITSLQQIDHMGDVELHGNPFLCFDLSYKTNILLPPGIALGKGVSHGFGVQNPYAPVQRKQRTVKTSKESQIEGQQFQAVALHNNGHEGI